MDETFKKELAKEKTCLLADRNAKRKAIKQSYQEIAAMYLHRYPHSLDELDVKIDKRCENGSAQEQELWRYMREYSNDRLLRVRNNQWAFEIIRLLREEPNSYFFAFGDGHFKGEHRVQKHLEAAGFPVDYVDANVPLNHDHEAKADRGFWYWFYQGFCLAHRICGCAILVSLLIRCTKITSPENNTNGDDIRDFLRFLGNLFETIHLHPD